MSEVPSGRTYQNIYHQLDEPFFPNPYGENSGISALHDLYPGRPMETSYGFNRYQIPPEDPEGARRTFLTNREETRAYAAKLMNRVVADGGGDNEKVLTHAVDDPSSVINDVDLKFAQMQTPETANNGKEEIEPPVVINMGPPPKESEGEKRAPVMIESFTPQEKEATNKPAKSDTDITDYVLLGFVLLLLLIALLSFLKV